MNRQPANRRRYFTAAYGSVMQCLVYLPHSYSGRGPAESCVRILAGFAEEGIDAHLHVVRARIPIPSQIQTHQSAGLIHRLLPWRFIGSSAIRRHSRAFAEAIDRAPSDAIAYFWPNVPADLVLRARARGLVCVREMINSPLATAKPLLDKAYAEAGIAPDHGLTDEMVARENEELALHDYIFASNPEVEAGLKRLGIPAQKILPTSFGWDKARFAARPAPPSKARPFRACYVGTINVRKGVHELLDGWNAAGIDGELWFAGSIDESLKKWFDEQIAADARITHFGHVDDIAAFYRQCDVFVFPTHEEGGPQVTYEAASCGLPAVTTPMGAARLTRDGDTGIVIPVGDSEAVATAFQRLSDDPVLCARLGENAEVAAAQFEYAVVGAQRAQLLKRCATRSTAD
ncbi:glycosyltransferase family 4 protein [Aurantiacibacter atlanticus]|nr:glycosyltransferase family 4 protein [Aurantiacibacter atlanticus]